MRHSLLPGLIDNLRFNLAHKARSFSAFHLGKAFSLTADGVSEERQNRCRNIIRGPVTFRFTSKRRGHARLLGL